MPFLPLNNDNSVYYERTGHGQPLVCISGFGGDHSVWDLVSRQWKDHFEVVVFDNLAVGQTQDSGQPISLEKCADMTVALIEQLGIAQPYIIGQSMGASIAQLIATRHPSLIKGLVLINPVTHLNLAAQFVLKGLTQLREANISFDLLFELGLPWFFSNTFLENFSAVANEKARIQAVTHPQSIPNQYRQLDALFGFDSRPWAHEITQQTLIIISDHDKLTPPSEGKELMGLIANAHLKLVDGGHASLIESYQQLGQIVLDFVNAGYR